MAEPLFRKIKKIEGTRSRRKELLPNLFQERFDAIFAVINIGGVKASTLFLIPDENDGYISAQDLSQSFKAVYSGTPVGAFQADISPRYVHHSMVKPGFVAEELVIYDHGQEAVVGFTRTPEGTKYGLPVGALAIEFELNTGISLASLFGDLHSRSEKVKAPHMRAHILQYLYDECVINHRQTTITEKELIDKLNIEGNTLYDNLLLLNKSRAIQYEAVALTTGAVSSYQIRTPMPREALPPLKRTRSDGIIREHLRMDVVDIIDLLCQSNTPITVDNIFAHINPRVREEYESDRALKKTIPNMLAELRRKGYLHQGDYRSRHALSQIHLTELGKGIVEELLIPLSEILNDNDESLKKYTNLANMYGLPGKIQEIAPRLADIYYPYSTSHKVASSLDKQYKLMEILKTAPKQGYAVAYLAKELGLDRETIHRHLKKMPKLIYDNNLPLKLVPLKHNKAASFYRIEAVN